MPFLHVPPYQRCPIAGTELNQAFTAPSSESESKPSLQGSRCLIGVDFAEAGGPWLSTRGNQVAVGVERKILDCRIGGARHRHIGVPARDVGLVECVESINPERKPPALTQAEAALQGEIELLLEAATEVVDAGLQSDAVESGCGKG